MQLVFKPKSVTLFIVHLEGDCSANYPHHLHTFSSDVNKCPQCFLALVNALWLNYMLWKCDLSQKTCDKLWCNYAGFPLVLLNGPPECCQILSSQLPLFLLLLKMKVFEFLFSINYGLTVLHKRWALRSRLISRCRAFSERSIVSRLHEKMEIMIVQVS